MKLAIMYTIILFSIPTYANELKKILVVYSYLPSSWNTNGAMGIKEAFRKEGVELILKEYVYDNIRVRKKKTLDYEVKKIKRIISNESIDGIIFFDDESSEDLIDQLNLELPIVATGINNNLENLTWYNKNKKIGIVLERYPFEESINLLKQLAPKTETISIMTSENNSSKIILNQILAKFKQYNNKFKGVKLKTVLSSGDWNRWKKTLLNEQVDNHSLWILVPWDVYIDKKEIPMKEISAFFRKNSKLPSIGIVDINKLMGFLSALSVHSKDLGNQAASLLIGMLKKNTDLEYVQVINKNRLFINKHRAKQLKIKIPFDLLEMATIERKKIFNTVR
jgi:ABC-type uncharacterized transport system substrate-binding protein